MSIEIESSHLLSLPRMLCSVNELDGRGSGRPRSSWLLRNNVSSLQLSLHCPLSYNQGMTPETLSPSLCSHCLVAQSCSTLCDPMDCSPPGSSVHGILQARMLSGLPCPPPGGLPDPGTEPESCISCIGRWICYP